MSKGKAGHLWSLNFDDGGGAQVLGIITSDFNPSFDEEDTTESQQSAEDTTLTLAHYTINGEFVYEEAADDVPKDDFIAAYFAKTPLAPVLLDPGGATTGNRRFTFTSMLITALSISNNGPGGVSKVSFTLRNEDGSTVTVGAVP